MLGLAWVVAGVGAVMLIASQVWARSGPSHGFTLACGVIGPLLALVYLASPAWRIVVEVDDDALTVRGRFRLAWADVREVVASDPTHTCFIDGGAPAQSLLVPGPGAPAPYRIENRDRLYAFVLAHVPAARVRRVERLELAERTLT